MSDDEIDCEIIFETLHKIVDKCKDSFYVYNDNKTMHNYLLLESDLKDGIDQFRAIKNEFKKTLPKSDKPTKNDKLEQPQLNRNETVTVITEQPEIKIEPLISEKPDKPKRGRKPNIKHTNTPNQSAKN